MNLYSSVNTAAHTVIHTYTISYHCIENRSRSN